MRSSFCLSVLVTATLGAAPVSAQQWLNAGPAPKTNQSSFRPVEEWPDANEYRNAGGMPGPKYWQQQVDYQIRASLDSATHTVTGAERVTHITTPTGRLSLVQLTRTSTTPPGAGLSDRALPEKLPHGAALPGAGAFDGGQDHAGAGGDRHRRAAKKADAPYTIVGTVMKVMPLSLLSPARSRGRDRLALHRA
jgi:hypothetical protein